MVSTVIAGKSVYHALEQATRGARKQVDQFVASLVELDESAGELVGRRGGSLLELAQHYLPEISHAAIQGTFRDIRDDLLEVLSRKQRRQRQLQQQIAEGEAKTERMQEELRNVTESLNEKVELRENLEQVVAERLEVHAEFQQLSQRALVAEQELDRNEQRVVEIKQEAAEKLPSYDGSRLFKYLHRRGFGTSGYQSRGFTKRLDRWVAKLINYNRARQGYDFLRVTPELMTQEVQRRSEEFNVLMEKIEAIEDQIADEVGLTTVFREGEELGIRRDELVASLEQLADSSANEHQEMLQLDGTQNKFYEEAIGRMKQFLTSLDQSRLEHRSQTTPEPEDDAIVGEIGWLGEQLDQTRQQSQTLERDRKQADENHLGLQRVLRQFRSAEFDSRRSLFSANFDVQHYVQNYLDGRGSAQQLWEAIRENQQFAPAWHEQQSRDGWDVLGDVVNSDFSYVLFRVLTDVAGQAMRNAAYRGMQRRGPIRRQRRMKTGRPRFPRRGFTNGRGF